MRLSSTTVSKHKSIAHALVVSGIVSVEYKSKDQNDAKYLHFKRSLEMAF